MVDLVSSITGIVDFFYPHAASLVCKALPDDNSLSLTVQSFLTSETQQIMDGQKGAAAGHHFNARARLQSGLLLLNGMLPEGGVQHVQQMHSMFENDATKTERRQNIVQDHFQFALDSANLCFGMGQNIKQSPLKPKQTIDALQIMIFCNTLLILESYAPNINFSVMVDSWITSVKYLYNNPNVKINIKENVEKTMFRNKDKSIALFEQIKALLMALLKTAESMKPLGGEKDMTRLYNAVHQSEHLEVKHHYFLDDSFVKRNLQQVLPVAMLFQPKGITQASHSDSEMIKDIKAYLQLMCENVGKAWGKLLHETTLEKCFVPPEIIEEEIGKEGERKNKATGKSVTNYKELFDIDTLGDRIIIEGDPGMGKTTYVNKLASDWTWDEGTKTYSHDIQFLQSKFTNIFLIPLRSLNGGRATTFEDAASIQLHNCGSFLGSNYNARPTECLLILDAFDEYDGSCQEINAIINGSQFPRLKVIITTRPSHLERLTIKNQWLSITGLTTPEKRDQFLAQQGWGKLQEGDMIINVLSSLGTLWHTPLYLAMLCVLYKAKKVTGFDPRNPDCFYILVKLFTDHIMSRKAKEGTLKKEVSQLKSEERRKLKLYIQKCTFDHFCQSNPWFADTFVTPSTTSDSEDFRELAGQFGLLTIREENSPVTGESVESVSFVHQLFLEYYAAVEFRTIFSSCTDKEGLVKLIKKNLSLTDSPFSYFLAAECKEYKEILVKRQVKWCDGPNICINSFPWLPEMLISNDIYNKYGQVREIKKDFDYSYLWFYCNDKKVKSFWDFLYVKELCSIAKPRRVDIEYAVLDYHDQSLDYILSMVNELTLSDCNCDHINLDKQYNNLTSFKLFCLFREWDCSGIVMLKHFPNLHELSLTDVIITNEYIGLLCDSLQNMNQLQKLMLHKCFKSPQSVQYIIHLANTIQTSSLYQTLKTLNLSENILDTETESSSDILMEAISKCVQLERLYLWRCQIKVQSLDIIKEIIHNSPHLKNNLRWLDFRDLLFLPPHTITQNDLYKWKSDIESILPYCYVDIFPRW